MPKKRRKLPGAIFPRGRAKNLPEGGTMTKSGKLKKMKMSKKKYR